jgi:hypothetical protein
MPLFMDVTPYILNKHFKPEDRGRVGKYSREIDESETSLEK